MSGSPLRSQVTMALRAPGSRRAVTFLGGLAWTLTLNRTVAEASVSRRSGPSPSSQLRSGAVPACTALTRAV
jgi:hypothetical protein